MPIGAFNPIDNAEDWDHIVIVGIVTPGLAVVGEFKRLVDWDTKVGKGTAGATETVKGLPPAKGSIDFFAWTVDHFAAWDDLLPQLKYDPTKQTKQANRVYHPSLADIDADSFNIESISNWVHQGAQLYKRTIELLEFAPAVNKSAAATPTGYVDSKPDASRGASPDPATAAMQKQADQASKDASKAYS